MIQQSYSWAYNLELILFDIILLDINIDPPAFLGVIVHLEYLFLPICFQTIWVFVFKMHLLQIA